MPHLKNVFNLILDFLVLFDLFQNPLTDGLFPSVATFVVEKWPECHQATSK